MCLWCVCVCGVYDMCMFVVYIFVFMVCVCVSGLCVFGCSCVCMYECGYPHTMVHKWRSEDNFRCQSLPSTLFGTGHLLSDAMYTSVVGWQAARDSSVSLPTCW